MSRSVQLLQTDTESNADAESDTDPKADADPKADCDPRSYRFSRNGNSPGAKLFNFHLGTQVSSGGDVLWDIHSSTLRTLNPKGKAKLANMGVVNFSLITAAKLKSLSYSTTPINGNKLATGDVFAVLTNGGNYAKVKVLGYGSNFTLSIRWVTYKG